jgi:large subunit ribosomal protein L2
MALRAARWLLAAAGKAPSAATDAIAAVGEPGQRVPWHKNKHKLYRHLPTTLKTWPGLTPGTTHRVELVKTALWKYRPVKWLANDWPSAAGRNCSGRITVRHRGGGLQFPTFTLNYRYSTPEVPKTLVAWQDSYRRSAWISLVYYRNGVFAYHPTVEGLQLGTMVFAHPGPAATVPQKGEWWRLGDVPAGHTVCNVESSPEGGGRIARAAGTFCTVLANKPEAEQRGLVPVLLPSKEVKLFPKNCWCTVGRIGCADHKFEKYGKAGIRRQLGWRPEVRGIAMNAVDHPHGGGKGGKCSGKRGGRRPGPWSVYRKLRAHHMKTRSKKLASWAFIARRRQKSRGMGASDLLQWTFPKPRAKWPPTPRPAKVAKAKKGKKARGA